MKDTKKLNLQGNVTLELLDKSGNTLEVRKENMVVNAGTDILIRKLSGVDEKLLFKTPVLIDNPSVPAGTNIKNPAGFIEGVNFEYIYSYRPSVLVEEKYSSGGFVYYNYKQITGNDITDLFQKIDSTRQLQVIHGPTIYTNYGVNYIGLGQSSVTNLAHSHSIFSYTSDWSEDPTHQYMMTSLAGEEISFSVKADSVAFVFDCDEGGYSSDISVAIDGVDITDPSIGKNIKVYDYSQYSNFSNFKEMADNNAESSVDPADITTTSVINTDAGTNSAINTGSNEFILDMQGYNNEEHTVTLTNNSAALVSFEGIVLNGLHKEIDSLYEELPVAINSINTPEIYNADEETSLFEINAHGQTIAVDNDEQPIIRVRVGDIEYTYVDPMVGVTPGNQEFTLSSNAVNNVVVEVSEPILNINVVYQLSGDFNTNYQRALIEKPDSGSNYPNYSYYENKIVYSGEFDKLVPNVPVKINQLALLNGIGSEDFVNRPFAITNINGLVKRPDDILRVKWEIVLE